MKNGMKGFAIAGALAAMLSPAAALAGKEGKSAKVHCEGANDCKGKGGCKSAKNDCSGQNGCKGQSFTEEKDAKTCEAKGGKVAKADQKADDKDEKKN